MSVRQFRDFALSMTTKLLMPKPGMGITEGTIARWLKAEGGQVKAGEVIAEVEFAKSVQEVPSPVTGVLAKILLAEGGTAEVLSEIALIEERR